MSEEIFERRFAFERGRIQLRPNGPCLVTAGALESRDEDGFLYKRGVVLLSGLDEGACRTTVVYYFGPQIASQMQCRLDTLSWSEWQADGCIVPLRVEWEVILSSMDRPDRRVSAHPLAIEWFMRPHETVRRFRVSAGSLAEPMLSRHGSLKTHQQTLELYAA